MKQRWYHKASVQSAIVNSVPNVIVATVAIVSLFISVDSYKKQVAQNQHNFDTQMRRDSLLNIDQAFTTKQNMNLAELQLQITKKQFLNDSVNKLKELLIANKEYSIFQKQNFESDVITKENLYVQKISILSYETKYQQGNVDSVFGFTPDVIYKETNNSKSNHFELLFSLTLFDMVNRKEIPNLPMLQTRKEVENYIYDYGINVPFQIMKKYTIVINMINTTRFPITILNDSKSYGLFENMDDSSFREPILFRDRASIYPNEKTAIGISFFGPLQSNLDKEFLFKLSLNYMTIYGKRNKKMKAYFSPEEKIFDVVE